MRSRLDRLRASPRRSTSRPPASRLYEMTSETARVAPCAAYEPQAEAPEAGSRGLHDVQARQEQPQPHRRPHEGTHSMAAARTSGLSSGLRREWNGSRSCERGGERGEDAEVGVERDPLKPSHSERLQAALVLEPPERTLDRSAPTVQVAPPLRFAGNQRVQPGRLAPEARGLALASRAAPFASFRLRSAPANVQVPCSQVGGRCSPRLTVPSTLPAVARSDARSSTRTRKTFRGSPS
jgi:hypothetical protein